MTTKNLVERLDKITGYDESLGKTIKTIRLCDEMKQREFASLLGVTVSYLSDLEHGRKIVSAKKAYEYAKKLGYSTKEFVRLALQDEANNFITDMGLHANVTIDFEKIRSHKNHHQKDVSQL
jgi:transcriptional regulator with XRE-family HTH domain